MQWARDVPWHTVGLKHPGQRLGPRWVLAEAPPGKGSTGTRLGLQEPAHMGRASTPGPSPLCARYSLEP